MSGMLVIHTDRQEGARGYRRKAALRHCLLPAFPPVYSQRICLSSSSGLTLDKTLRNQYFLFQAPQWTLSFAKVWVDRVLSLRPSFLGLQTEAKGAEVSTDHLKLFLSRRRWQVSLSRTCLCPFHTNFLPRYFFSTVNLPPSPTPTPTSLPPFLPELPSHCYIFLQS